jgi:hypothetical protein
MTVWNSISFAEGVEATSFNEVVSGGSFLGAGNHKGVMAQDVERGTSQTGNPKLIITWANEDGARIMQHIPLKGRDKDGNEVLHFVFRMVMSALIPSRELRANFLNAAFADSELFEGLKGTRADIKIKPPEEGFDVREDAMGGYIVHDIATGKPELEGESFDSFQDAKEAARDADLKPAYASVNQVSKPSDEGFLAANNEGVETLLAAAAKPKAKPQARSARL